MTQNKVFTEKYLRPLLVALSPFVWFGILWAASAIIDNPLILPAPHEILLRFFGLATTAVFYRTVFSSLLRILAGLAVGVILGTLLGLFSFLFAPMRTLFRPLLGVVRATPVASSVILIWSLTGSKILPLVIAALMVIPIVADQLVTGLEKADPALGEVSDLYGFAPHRRLVVYRLPAALPYFFSSIVTSAGFAWKAGIAAEILATTKGSIGREIYFSKTYMETLDLWAWTLAVILFSLLLELIVKKTLRIIERRTK